MLADSLAYRPWAIGQFGSAGASIPLPAGWSVVEPAADCTIPVDAASQLTALPVLRQLRPLQHRPATYPIARHGGLQVGDRLSGQNGYVQCSAAMVRTFAAALPWEALARGLQNR